MDTFNKGQKKDILDTLGEMVIKEVRDRALRTSMDIVKCQTVNPVKREYYKDLSSLTSSQQEIVCDLLSETITDTLYLFLEMFEEKANAIRFLVIKDGQEHDLLDISEKMGSEIASFGDDGWVQKFSQLGRFVL